MDEKELQCKEVVKNVIKKFVFVEEKIHSIVWHYRNVTSIDQKYNRKNYDLNGRRY